jgi:hypothetical protein
LPTLRDIKTSKCDFKEKVSIAKVWEALANLIKYFYYKFFQHLAGHWWLMPIILTTWEAEVRKIREEKVCTTPFQHRAW